MKRVLLVLVSALLLGIPMAQACGISSHCWLGDRHYRVSMPANHDGKTLVGAIVFAHGLGGNAEGIVGSRDFARMASDLGIAIIATKATGRAWALPGSPSAVQRVGVDDLTYFDAVIEDATRRFAIDKDRLMATGFSAGGMMIWTLACHRSEAFAAFAPMAGTFWRPIPKSCTTPPASLIHIHGDRDKTVPLKGRKVRDAQQGDVKQVLDMYSQYGSFTSAGQSTVDNLRCENQVNSNSDILRFCLFSGGHSFRTGLVKSAWRMFEKAGKL